MPKTALKRVFVFIKFVQNAFQKYPTGSDSEQKCIANRKGQSGAGTHGPKAIMSNVKHQSPPALGHGRKKASVILL